MALSSSPRKTVPLASGDEPSRSQLSLQPSVTRRVFYCGVVVEGSEHGRRLPEEIQELVLSLGKHLGSEEDDGMLSRRPDASADADQSQRKRALTDTSALASVINELVSSERSYVHRLEILKKDYADPLRNFARSKDTAIIPPYEAKILFGNIDNLIPVNKAFLVDLDKMVAADGPSTVGGIGDVALKHFKEYSGFEQYKQYYVKREEAQRIFEREISKRGSRFGNYIDRIKYQSTDSKNRIGLRELLMEPVQRIPRYTLLFRTILKHMAPNDPQRAKLLEADEIASKIAQAEADEQTKRAAIFYCLSTTVEGFPPDLFSFQRKFIDCIDVEDIIGEGPLSSHASSAGGNSATLHCTLFLFDDKLVIVKRSNSDKAGRTLSGLDDLDRLTKGPPSMIKKRTGLSCKGVVEITDVAASDPGGPDIHLYLENPPQDQSDRWSGRPFRSLSVVLPPSSINLDPIQTEAAKRRFLENLWLSQAMYRARHGQSVVLCSEDQQVEHKSNRTTYARTYYNVYTRTSFLQEPKKTKVVVHIDPLGSADPIPFGMGCAPILRIRVQPMAGSVCRLVAQSFDPDEPGDDDVIRSDKVDKWIIDTIHRFGLFTFRTHNSLSVPSTPTARSRANRFGLDTISRNLFNSRPASAMGDLFGGSMNGHRRAKSTTASRSSMYTTTTATDSFFKSSRSQSTVGTSVDDTESLYSSRSSNKGGAKLRKEYSESDASGSLGRSFLNRSFRHSISLTRSRSHSRDRSEELSDDENDGVDAGTITKNAKFNDDDLALQLEIARQNSLNQEASTSQVNLGLPPDPISYEDEPPQPVTRPSSRASADVVKRSVTPRPPKQQAESPDLSERDSRPQSRLSERKPLGPRGVSPNPLAQSATSVATFELKPVEANYESDDDELFEMDMANKTPSRRPRPSGIPRSKRMPAIPPNNLDATPRPGGPTGATPAVPTSVEPLSIKKKTSVRGPAAASSHSPTPTRKIFGKTSPGANKPTRASSPRKTSPQMKRPRGFSAPTLPIRLDLVDEVLRMAGATKTEIEQSLRLIKRMKGELEKPPHSNHSPAAGSEDSPRAISPDKALRTPPIRNNQPIRSNQPLTREAQQRMEEMQRLLGHRANSSEGARPGRLRAGAIFEVPSPSSGHSGPSEQLLRSLAAALSEADQCLTRASSNQDKLERGVNDVTAQYKEKLVEQERMRLELQQSKRQTELVKELLADATAEKEIMYETFNEELDSMYSDLNQSGDGQLAAITEDLKAAKATRNQLSLENAELKRRLAEVELQNAAWTEMLRQHGLLSS